MPGIPPWPWSAGHRSPRSSRSGGGWAGLCPWYSSFGTDFNYDFHVTLDHAVAPVEYNYRGLAELGPEWRGWSGEMFGVSGFLRRGDRVFHTYSS
jgi:predicted dithiol-disulfide oxidoreductase (DUF899 family)